MLLHGHLTFAKPAKIGHSIFANVQANSRFAMVRMASGNPAWANVDPDLCRHMASLGHNQLIKYHCIGLDYPTEAWKTCLSIINFHIMVPCLFGTKPTTKTMLTYTMFYHTNFRNPTNIDIDIKYNDGNEIVFPSPVPLLPPQTRHTWFCCANLCSESDYCLTHCPWWISMTF